MNDTLLCTCSKRNTRNLIRGFSHQLRVILNVYQSEVNKFDEHDWSKSIILHQHVYNYNNQFEKPMYRSNWSTHLDSQKLDLSANDPIRPWRLWCLIFTVGGTSMMMMMMMMISSLLFSTVILTVLEVVMVPGRGWPPNQHGCEDSDSSDSSSDTGGSDSSDPRRSSHRLTPNLYNGHI